MANTPGSEADAVFASLQNAAVSVCAAHRVRGDLPPLESVGSVNAASIRGRRRLERDGTPPPTAQSAPCGTTPTRPVVDLSAYHVNEQYQQHVSVPRVRTYSFPEHWAADERLAHEASDAAARLVDKTIESVRCAPSDVSSDASRVGPRTFVVSGSAALLHVWRSRREARRFHEALRRAAQAKFEHMVPSPVHVPLAALVAHQGALVSVVWLPPLYPRSTMTVEKQSTCFLVADVLRAALHLRRGQPLSLYFAADGRFYCLLPPSVVLHHAFEAAAATDAADVVSTIADSPVRAELLDRNAVAWPLMPAAVPDHLLRSAEADAAAALVAYFAVPDDQRTVALRQMATTIGVAYRGGKATSILHEHGVPLRRAGEVLLLFKTLSKFKSRDNAPFVDAAVTVLKAEMVARSLVAHLSAVANEAVAAHAGSSSAGTVDAEMLTELVEAAVSESFTKFFRSSAFFGDVLLPVIRQKFFANDDSFAACPIRRDDVRPCLIPLVHFVAKRVGFRLTKDHKTLDGVETSVITVSRAQQTPLAAPRAQAELQQLIRLTMSHRVPRGVRVRHALRALHGAAASGDATLLAEAFTNAWRTIESMSDAAACREESADPAHIPAVLHLLLDAAPGSDFEGTLRKLLSQHRVAKVVPEQANFLGGPELPSQTNSVNATPLATTTKRGAQSSVVISPDAQSGPSSRADGSTRRVNFTPPPGDQKEEEENATGEDATPPPGAAGTPTDADDAEMKESAELPSLRHAQYKHAASMATSVNAGVSHSESLSPKGRLLPRRSPKPSSLDSPLIVALRTSVRPVFEELFFAHRLASYADAASTIVFAAADAGRSLAPVAGSCLLAATRHLLRGCVHAELAAPAGFAACIDAVGTTLERAGNPSGVSWQCAEALSKSVLKVLLGMSAASTSCDGGAWRHRCLALFTDLATSHAANLIASCGVARAVPKPRRSPSRSPEPTPKHSAIALQPSPSSRTPEPRMDCSLAVDRSGSGRLEDSSEPFFTASPIGRGLVPLAASIAEHAIDGQVTPTAELQFRLHVLLCAAGECGPEIVALTEHLHLTPEAGVQRRAPTKLDVATLLTPLAQRQKPDLSVRGTAATKESLRVSLSKVAELTTRRRLPADVESWQPVGVIIRALFNMPGAFDISMAAYNAIRAHIVALASPAVADTALALPAAGIARVRRVIANLREVRDPVAREPFRRGLIVHTEDIGMRAVLRARESVGRDILEDAFLQLLRDGVADRETIARGELRTSALGGVAAFTLDEESAARGFVVVAEEAARAALADAFRNGWERATLEGVVGRGGARLFDDDTLFRRAAVEQEACARRLIELQWAELAARSRVEAELLRPAHALEALPRFSLLIAEDYLREFHAGLGALLVPAHESFARATAAMEAKSRQTIQRLFMIDAPRKSYAPAAASSVTPTAAARGTATATKASPTTPPPIEQNVSGNTSGRENASVEGDWCLSDRNSAVTVSIGSARAIPPAVQRAPAAAPAASSPAKKAPAVPNRAAKSMLSSSPKAATQTSPKFGRRANGASSPTAASSSPVAPVRRRR